MKFSIRQKEIINKIASGEIYNISSYLKAFNLTTFRKLDKNNLEKKFYEEENGKKYKKLKDGVQRFYTTTSTNNALGLPMPEFHYINPKEEDYEYVEAILEYNATKMTIQTISETKFEFDYSEGINFTNSFNDIKEFLAIWQYLKSEGLVLEVDKKIDRSDYEIFFEYKPISETHYGKRESLQTHFSTNIKSSPVEFKYPFAGEDSTRIKDFRNYIDYFFEYNKENEIVCSQFIGKQIISTPDLVLFIDRKYRTREQISTILNLIPAYAALVLTLLITIYQEYDNNKDMKKIFDELSIIQTQLVENKFTTNDLNYIEKQLEKISQMEFDDSVLQNTLDEILQAIETLDLSEEAQSTIVSEK